MGKQYWMDEKPDKYKIVIENSRFKIQAPLPDEFGMTVGSEFSEPFDVGAMSDTWGKAFALGGVGQKFGIRMEKMFTNPEPTEVSFELELAAYYSAKDEVFMPIVELVSMALGTEIKWDDVKGKVKELSQLLGSASGAASGYMGGDSEGVTVDTSAVDTEEADKYGNKLMGLIKLIESPEKCRITFGNVMKWTNMYITSVAPQFSNQLDSAGFPLKARVSVTATPYRYPVADDMLKVFGAPD